MSGYNKLLSIVLAATAPNIEPIAAMIGRALDPDLGGDKSFTLDGEYVDGGFIPSGTLSTALYVTEEAFSEAQHILASVDNLFSFTQHDYATRWPELTPPTRTECEVFIDSILAAGPVLLLANEVTNES